MGKKNKENVGEKRRIQSSSRVNNLMMFLIFVAIAAVFWFIIALNDNVTETFNVRLNILNVPDSVTFINEPPKEIHLTVRDKGTNILRSGVVKNPTISLNFSDYASDGVFRVSQTELMAEIKSDLGGGAQISFSSVDSLRFHYAVGPGKRVPIVVHSNVTAANGYVIEGNPTPVQKSALIYSYRDEIDTIHVVYTKNLVKKDLSQSTRIKVKMVQIPGVRIIPSTVDVNIVVQPLVSKEVYVEVDPLNVPEGVNLILFPNRVPVSYFVPMSHFNDENINVHVVADYNDVAVTSSSMIPVRISSYSPYLINVRLMTDSVEYTLVK